MGNWFDVAVRDARVGDLSTVSLTGHTTPEEKEEEMKKSTN